MHVMQENNVFSKKFDIGKRKSAHRIFFKMIFNDTKPHELLHHFLV